MFRITALQTSGASWRAGDVGGIMKSFKTKIAIWMYRYSLAQSMVGIVIGILNFAGIFTLLLGPLFLQNFGLSYATTLFLLVGSAALVILGFGFFLDRIAKFWKSQALVGTVRNPFLVSRLYEKELLTIVTQHIPVLKAVRMLLNTESLDARAKLLNELDASIARLERTARDRQWTILPGEDVYEDSR